MGGFHVSVKVRQIWIKYLSFLTLSQVHHSSSLPNAIHVVMDGEESRISDNVTFGSNDISVDDLLSRCRTLLEEIQLFRDYLVEHKKEKEVEIRHFQYVLPSLFSTPSTLPDELYDLDRTICHWKMKLKLALRMECRNVEATTPQHSMLSCDF